MTIRRCVSILGTLSFVGLQTQASAQLLGSAGQFAVLAGSTVTNTGGTVLNGDLGVWAGTAITGFPPGIVNGTTYAGDAVAMQAQADLTTAYNTIAGEAVTQDLTGQDLGGLELGPGVYHFDSSAFLTGTLILNAMGNPNARFDFQIGSTLIANSPSSVEVINGGSDEDIYWQVGSSATLNTGSAFEGNILADASITLDTGATIVDGRALAITGAVTLDDNTITAVPDPAPWLTLGAGVLVFGARRRRR